MTDDTNIQNIQILVELRDTNIRGVQDVSIGRDSLEKVAERSEEAFENAMQTIKTVATRAITAVKEINYSDRPDEIEVDFGLKLTASGGVLISNVGVETQINVKLKWQRKQEDEEKEVTS
jgi:signal transduction histidine kinase